MAGLGVIKGSRNPKLVSYCAKATLDITNGVHAGTVADAVGLGVVIPDGAIVTRVIGSVVTALAGAGSSMAINIGSTEVNAATAFDHNDYVGVDVHYDTPVKLAAASEVNVDISGAEITGGVYDIFVEYLM